MNKHVIYQLRTLRWICREAGEYTKYRGYGDTPEEAHKEAQRKLAELQKDVK